MPDIYGTHFEYGGVDSRKFGLVIVNAESSRFKKLSGDVSSVTVFNKKTKQNMIVDNDYSKFPISFDVDIITDNERGISLQDRRLIEKWLFNRRDYRRLYFDMFDDPFAEMYEVVNGEQKRLYLNCRLINPTRLEYNGGIVGYKCTVEADSGMWWQDAITASFTLPKSNVTSNITITLDTDLDDYTYPVVSFILNSSSITIVNHSDDSSRLTQLDNVSSGTILRLDGNKNFVSGVSGVTQLQLASNYQSAWDYLDTATNNYRYYEKLVTRNFPRLVDGENRISITGNVPLIEFKYCNRRML